MQSHGLFVTAKLLVHYCDYEQFESYCITVLPCPDIILGERQKYVGNGVPRVPLDYTTARWPVISVGTVFQWELCSHCQKVRELSSLAFPLKLSTEYTTENIALTKLQNYKIELQSKVCAVEFFFTAELQKPYFLYICAQHIDNSLSMLHCALCRRRMS